MSQRKSIKEKLQLGLTMLLNLGLGAGLALAVLPWAFRHFADQSLLVFEGAMLGALLVCGVVSYMLMITLHEAGHMAAGLASGYSFVSFRVGSVMLIRLQGKLQLKRFSLVGTAGQCLMKPPAWTDKGIPVQLYNWGGVMVNAAMALLALPGVLLLPMDTIPGMLLLSILIVNVYALLANGLPLNYNDGANALHLVRNLDTQYAFWQQMTANALLAEGVSLRDLPPELYTLREGSDLNNQLIAVTAVSAAQMPMNFHRFDEAERAIRELLDRPEATLMPAHRFLLQNDLLWLELTRQSRPEELAAIKTKEFLKYRKAMASMPAVIRTAYTEALLAGDSKEADKQRALFAKISATYPYQQEISAEQALIQLAENRI